MNFINLFISDDYSIRVEHKSLVLDGEQKHTFPLEDIGVVLIESLKCVITTYALNKLSEFGATVFVCNEKHLPTAIILPCNDYYKQLKRYKVQQNLSKPRQKSLWKSIVEKKIENQAHCLSLTRGGEEKLCELAKKVRSGDVDNIEAQAAAYYFPKLFGERFTRDDDNAVNGALNYAYAIVRGIIARQIAARGLLPFLGIFHKNEFNSFNLADDLIEPFRPIVDYFVYSQMESFEVELTPANKRTLFQIVNLEVFSGKEKHALSYAVEREVESVIAYYEGRDELIFPQISGLKQHEYE